VFENRVPRKGIIGPAAMKDRLCGLVVKSFWLQVQRSRVRFPAIPDFLKVRGLERVPLSLVRTIEELLE
jgi:hypothetical protein